MTRTLTLCTVLFALAVTVPATASAAVTVGLGEQNRETFSDEHFQSLGLKRTRVVTPWNVALSITGARTLSTTASTPGS